MRRAARADANQPEIVEALRSIGCHVEHTHQLKGLFDILVGYRGKLFIMEIKDGSKPPSATKLTPDEIKCKEAFERVGVKYNIVYTPDQAIEIVTS